MFKTTTFRPCFWAKNPHFQTIFGAIRRHSKLHFKKHSKRFELIDGDFIDLDIFEKKDAETVLLLHGLEGSSESSYIRAMVEQFICRNKQVVVMYFRSCSGEPNRLLKSYHSGVSHDLQLVIEGLSKQAIKIDYLVGFSLGGNVLLKWLGENHTGHKVKAAVAVSVPLLLDESANTIDQGFSKLYSKRLLKTLKLKAIAKKIQFPKKLKLSVKEIKQIDSFWQFDHLVTAPINGFDSAADYYQKASSRQFLKHIQVPTLIIHALDDPFMNQKVIPEQCELAPVVNFELHQHGGHVGFVGGRWPWKPEYYLDKRIPEFLDKLR